MWRGLTDSSPLPLPHKITNPSLSRTKLSIPQPTRSFPSRPCFSSSLIKPVVSSPSTCTESGCTRISHILHVSIFLTDLTSSSLFLSLSLSPCLVRFVSYSLIHIHTIFPAPSAPSSQALSARFIHTLGYVQNVAFIMVDVELLLVLLHPTKYEMHFDCHLTGIMRVWECCEVL